MTTRRSVVVGCIVAGGGLLGVVGATVMAEGNGGAGKELDGAVLERATAAALAYTGGGNVVDSEIGDEHSYYEIEVARPDESVVGVELDPAFRVTGTHDEPRGK